MRPTITIPPHLNCTIKKKVATPYPYSFQGQEADHEVKGEGNSVNYKYRMHDARIGRFFAVDPLAPKYPHNSPYAFSENNVIHAVELEGLEKKEIIHTQNDDGTETVTVDESCPDYYGYGNEGNYHIYADGSTEYFGPPTGKEAAYMANDVYNAGTTWPYYNYVTHNTNWKLNGDVRGVQEIGAYGFKSGFYNRKDTYTGEIWFVYATAGTDDGYDVSTDIRQSLNIVETQIPQSVSNAKFAYSILKKREGFAGLTFVGHSLGGGLAEANARYTGLKAITFNQMQLTNFTVKKYGLKHPKLGHVTEYIIAGEAVQYLQKKILGLSQSPDANLLTNPERRPGTSFGRHSDLKTFLWRIRGHSMSNFFKIKF